MVASSHNLNNLGVSHIASASQHQNHHNSQQIQQVVDKTQHIIPCGKLNQSAQDKRSRLSNLINNLRKKVPPEINKCDSKIIIGEDKRNTTKHKLGKYVMTVLSGVIEGEERSSSNKNLESEKSSKGTLIKSPDIVTKNVKDSNGVIVVIPTREEDIFPTPKISFEPSKANESKVIAAVPVNDKNINKNERSVVNNEKQVKNEVSRKTKIIDFSPIVFDEKYTNDVCNLESQNQQNEEAEENLRSLGAIILDRLHDHYQDQSSQHETITEIVNFEVRTVCQELISDLLNDIIQTMEISDQTSVKNKSELHSDNFSQSLHCSLPLDKVVSALQTCKTLNSPPSQISNVLSTIVRSNILKITPSLYVIDKLSIKKSTKSALPTVKHLCLYCDRKFLSISLRQRHIERVHQTNGGRRSERNSRKPSQQNCQYCLNKCSENLEGLFQHMVCSHSDKYHGCLQCSTRYLTRDALTLHIQEIHSHVTVQMEKLKEPISTSIKDIKTLNEAVVNAKEELNTVIIKQLTTMEQSVNPNSAIFDNTFYSSVSCNIRENLLHHIDGKIQLDSFLVPSMSSTICNLMASPESNNKTSQYQLPIDISLTAIAPIYNKDYPMVPEDYENSSECAGKPGKTCNQTHPRRVSFEKYNFPRKYDGKEQWSFSIKDLSKFDISTQLALRKKQRFIKECAALNKSKKVMLFSEIDQRTKIGNTNGDDNIKKVKSIVVSSMNDNRVSDSVQEKEIVISDDGSDSDMKNSDVCINITPHNILQKEPTVFSSEFENFIRLQKWNDDSQDKSNLKIVYAELTGEWSRPRVYVCGACAERYVTLKELEEHKSSAHPNVWCMHFEFSGDQRELYKHLMFLPGRCSNSTTSMKTRQQTINSPSSEKICTKCAKNCANLAELHRHMLECGGDQAWLLGLFGNGKKKCKWRPFGSRSRRRRQRGMKRNIQNSQNSQSHRNILKDKPTTSGPRVRPSDRESIQKMLANLPAKRSTRKALQENAARSHSRLRNAQSRTTITDNPSSRIMKNKAVLRNKLLKNAKSFHRKKNLRKEKQMEKKSQINGEKLQVSRNTRLYEKKKKISLSITEIENPVQQLKRDIKMRNSIYTIPTNDKSVLLSSDTTTKNTTSTIAKAESNSVSNMRSQKRITDRLNASLKAKTQLRTNDGKFACIADENNVIDFDNKSIKIGKKPSMDHLHLLTRSKLRAAAKMAWKEHTTLSRRITRLHSLNANKTITTKTKPVNYTFKDDLIKFVKLQFPKTETRNYLSNQHSFDGNVLKVTSEEILEKFMEDKTEQASLTNSRCKRIKKDNSVNFKSITNVTENMLVSKQPKFEISNEPKTRSQKTSFCDVFAQAKLESKTSRSLINIHGIKKVNAELPKKNKKKLLSLPFLENTEADKKQFGLITRSISRATQDVKKKNEYYAKNTAKKISTSKKVNKKKLSKRIQKEIINKRLTVTVEKSIDLKAKFDAPSRLKKKEKNLLVRKSPRNKKADIKEIVNENKIKTTEKISSLSSKFVKTNDKNGTVIKIIEDKFPEENLVKNWSIVEEKSVSHVLEKKLIVGRRRGRTKHLIENSEKIKTPENSLFEENENKFERSKSVSETTEYVSPSLKINAVEELSLTNGLIKSSNLQNVNLEHLQQETSNSNMDSGKENSLETIINVSKLKVVRPKKLRGLRRDKATTAKRSLNSVIGILTEGINVPVDTQDTTVLTVQTSINNDNNNFENTYENNHDSSVENSLFSLDESNIKSIEIFNLNTKTNTLVLNELETLNDEKVQKVNKNPKSDKYDSQINEKTQKEPVLVLKKQINSEKIEPNLIVIKEPENDIILDLAKRKSKGKGSFLEKIVSKIAKQKDVSLDSEINCQIDSIHTSLENQNEMNNDKKIKVQEFNNISELKKNENTKTNIKYNENSLLSIINNTENMILFQKDFETKIKILPKKEKINYFQKNIREKESTTFEETKIKTKNQLGSKVEVKNEIINSIRNEAHSNENLDSKSLLIIPENKEIKTKIEEKRKFKKRSLRNKFPEKNKKKIIDNEDVSKEENKKEISLADIMKLIERPKSRNLLNVNKNIVEPGERKMPDDNTEFNNINTSISTLFELKKNKEAIKKLNHRNRQEKNRSNIDNINENRIIKETKKKNNSDENLEKQDKEDENLNIQNINNEIILQKESCIFLRSSIKNFNENKSLKYEQIDTDNNENKILHAERIPEKKDENRNINFAGIENSELENSITIEKHTKGGKKMSKNSAKINKSSKRFKNSLITIDKSFKFPESTEIFKPSKKCTIRRKSNIKMFANDQKIQKNENNITDKHKVDEKLEISNNGFAINLLDHNQISELEEKFTAKQVLKRHTHNSQNMMSTEFFVTIKESENSDISSTNEFQPLKRRHSQRNNLLLVHSNVSISSADEIISSTECNAKKKWILNKKIKKNISVGNELYKLISDSEKSEKRKNKNIEISLKEEIINKNIDGNIDINEKEPIGEKILLNINKIQEQNVFFKDENELQIKKNMNNIIEIDRTSEIDKYYDEISNVPLSITSSLDNNLDVINKQSSINLDISCSEFDETSNFHFQTPKNRIAGNFTVVTKSGKILIVEKKKKLTKEIAKFFCKICTTSFTRKSSLKKHNLSQSHILQMTKDINKDISKKNQELSQIFKQSKDFVTDNSENINKQETESESKKENKNNDINIRSEKELKKKIIEESKEVKTDKKTINIIKNFSTDASIISEPLIIHKSLEEELEDEMLNEEICKITENMSHDEYVLTDHVSPGTPEVSPMKENDVHINETDSLIKITELKTVSIKKKEKKKKNLADEHLDLNTPVSTKILQLESDIISISNIDVQNLSPNKFFLENNSTLSNKKVFKITKYSENIGTEDMIDKYIPTSNEIKNKSKKCLKMNIFNKVKKANRNNNQNNGLDISVNILENLRPKRNKLRPSYKEDENFDFDMIEFSEEMIEEKQEFPRSKQDKNKMNLTEFEKNNYKSKFKRQKNSSKKQQNDTNISVSEISISNPEKDDWNKNFKSKKNNNKISKLHDTKYLNVDLNIQETMNESYVVNSISKSMLEKGNNLKLQQKYQAIIEKMVPELQNIEASKKKRGRKPKQTKLKKEASVIEKNVLIKNEKIPIVVIETVIENKINIADEKAFDNNSKSIINQRKKNKIINSDVEKKITENDYTFNETDVTKILSKETTTIELKQKNDEIKSKSNILLESSLEISVKTLTNPNEINILSVPSEVSKFSKLTDLPETLRNKINEDTKLVFPDLNIDNFKAVDDKKNEVTVSMLTEFDSDDNSSDTKMSVDIQKLLDDSEMMTEIAKQPNKDTQDSCLLSNIKRVNIVNTKEPISKMYSSMEIIVDENKMSNETSQELKNQDNIKTISINKKSTDNKSLKISNLTENKSKHRGRKLKNNSSELFNRAYNLSDESEIEANKQEDKIQKNKNKIVKSVFGRVFSGEKEKIDKVKKVLDGWQSRSEYNTSDSEMEKSTRNYISTRRKSLRNNSVGKKPLKPNSRSRQSKKRAEKLISRTFKNYSPILNKNHLVKIQHLSGTEQSKPMISFQKKLNDDDFSNDNYLCNNSVEVKQVSFKSKRRKEKNVVKETEISIVNLRQSKYRRSNEVIKDIIDKSKESQVTESKIEQERIQSFKIKNINNYCEKSKDEKLNSKISPLYICESSINETNLLSLTSSENDNNHQEVEKGKTKSRKKKLRDSTNVFVAEKLRLKSPQIMSSHENTNGSTQVTTIAPRDAIVGNTLDFEISLMEKNNPERVTRQASKVLNFDEELFVECCSRLKASSEKELRGAKKIKLDHPTDQIANITSYHQYYHRKDERLSEYIDTKNKWSDVESQNSLGSLLESVNQLLGEEYNTEQYSSDITKNGRHHHYYHHSHNHDGRYNCDYSIRSVSSEEEMVLLSTNDNLNYDDSLDVAFKHNNNLRNKIQRRMRESENLIATSFEQKNTEAFKSCVLDGTPHVHSKMNNGLNSILDKALSNLLHNNEKHDQNGSTPMKVLAELACARVPTSVKPIDVEKSSKLLLGRKEDIAIINECNQQHNEMLKPKFMTSKKSKNPIKKSFENNHEFFEKKQLERTKISVDKYENKWCKQRNEKKTQQNLPFIRAKQYHCSLTESERHRDFNDSINKNKKQNAQNETIKDVYDFDEEESTSDPGFISGLSYRTKPDIPEKVNMSTLFSKTIGDTLTNGKSISTIDVKLENMVDCKFRNIKKLPRKTKINKKKNHVNNKHLQKSVIGQLDVYLKRKQESKYSSSERSTNKNASKLKKKGSKSTKKKSRNAWYENDSSDEFVTKLKAEDIGVGISKSQRTCSKGKQNLFAEISSTSSESEYDRVVEYEDKNNFEVKNFIFASESTDQMVDELVEQKFKNIEKLTNYESQNGERQDSWPSRQNEAINVKYKSSLLKEDKKTEFKFKELSNYPLVIEKNFIKFSNIEQCTKNNNETEEHIFKLNDLYRADCSIVESDQDGLPADINKNRSSIILKFSKTALPLLPQQSQRVRPKKYIIVEDAVKLLDRPQKECSKKSRPTFKAFQNKKRQHYSNLCKYVEEEFPEKLSSNEKPHRKSENLPLHVFLSRKVQESKKRKQQQQLRKLKEEQERLFLDMQPTRRQRKCAVGKQGLLAEISSSDEELLVPSKKFHNKLKNHERLRGKQKQRELKEKRKERYIEKKHEQMIAKEQKAIEEAIMRELEEKRQNISVKASFSEKDEKKQSPTKDIFENGNDSPLKSIGKSNPQKKHWYKQKINKTLNDTRKTNICKSNIRTGTKIKIEDVSTKLAEAFVTSKKKKMLLKKSRMTKNQTRFESCIVSLKRCKNKEQQYQQHPRSLSNKQESDLENDEELKAAKSWNKVDKGVGVAIGRRKRASTNHLYYWSSSSDEEEYHTSLTVPAVMSTMTLSSDPVVQVVSTEASELGSQGDHQEQHGWIVGDSHKKMITMLAMEKQMKEKRRRSDNDIQSSGSNSDSKTKNKKHKNNTS